MQKVLFRPRNPSALFYRVVVCLLCIANCFKVHAQAPTITLQLTNQFLWNIDVPRFTVTATGPGPLTYQWVLNGSNLPLAMLTTIAGTGQSAHSGDGGPATNAGIWEPAAVAIDSVGNLYVAEEANGYIRKIDTNGIITTIAGGGHGSSHGDGGPATNAILSRPYGVTIDPAGNLFIADMGNSRVRKIDTNGIITTFAGGGIFNPTNQTIGDGGPATNAILGSPTCVAIDSFGNCFIADQQAGRVRKVDTNGNITTVAGGGSFGSNGSLATNVALGNPTGVAVDAVGNLFIAEQTGNIVQKVDTNGIISVFAGNGKTSLINVGDGGQASNASLNSPNGVLIDPFGNVLIVDTLDYRVRKVDTNGIITTIVGSGSRAPAGDDSPANSGLAGIYPYGIVLDSGGDMFITDYGNNRIREVVATGLPELVNPGSGIYSVIVSNAYGSVTSAVVTVKLSSSPLIPQAIGNADGSITLGLLTKPSTTSRLLSATNLQPPISWQPLFTNTPGNTGFWQFTDTNTAGSACKFYKTSTP
jgi:sugar lactone lactonase YvrE